MRAKVNLQEHRYNKLITLSNPKSPISESFRTLRTNIQFASIDKPLNTIMFTSTGPSEGKSTIVANLAVVIAQSDKKVLLVDADLRKPTVHHTFKLPNRQGLSKALVYINDLQTLIQKDVIPNLDILSSGPIPPNPADLLGSKKMLQLIEELKGIYDVVLFDAPPTIAVTDAQILSRSVDGVLLVINSGKTHKEMTIKAKGLLEKVHANVIGVVLNNKETKGEDYYYYYGNS